MCASVNVVYCSVGNDRSQRDKGAATSKTHHERIHGTI